MKVYYHYALSYLLCLIRKMISLSVLLVSGERPFECNICQKRFTLKHSMMRHRRKHTNAEIMTLDSTTRHVKLEGSPECTDDEGAPLIIEDNTSNCSDNTSNGRTTPAWDAESLVR